MKHFSQLAFVVPSAHQQSTEFATLCTKSSVALFPLGKSASGNIACRSNSLTLGAESMDASVGLSMTGEQPSGVYEAVLPQTETLVGMGFIVVLCVVLYWVWENQVVPVSRTKLAISKSRGEVKEYLDELKASEIEPDLPSSSSELMSSEIASRTDSMGDSALQTTNITVDSEEEITGSQSLGPPPATSLSKPNRAFEKWLFTDWLIDNKSEGKAGRQKEPALPILKNAKWNSGDNPVVVAAFLMMVGLVFTALTERLS